MPEEERMMFKEKTLRLRHGIVKLIAPKLYMEAMDAKTVKGWFYSSTPRPATCFAKEYFGEREIIGAEIGVAQGENAENLLKELHFKRLYLIDPYVPYFEDAKMITTFVSAKEIAIKRLSAYPQVQFIFKQSSEAYEMISDKLDFVYIDGNHAYDYVKKDIELYYELVKSGGILGGHDFTPFYPGVMKAVLEFTTSNCLVYSKDFFIQFPDWWIIKS